MNFNEYQTDATALAIYGKEYAIIYPVLGLTGEAGEVSDKIKKVLRDKNSIFDEETKLEIAKELGDVLWYLSALAKDIGYTLEEIAKLNLDKLYSRRERNKIQGDGDNR